MPLLNQEGSFSGPPAAAAKLPASNEEGHDARAAGVVFRHSQTVATVSAVLTVGLSSVVQDLAVGRSFWGSIRRRTGSETPTVRNSLTVATCCPL